MLPIGKRNRFGILTKRGKSMTIKHLRPVALTVITLMGAFYLRTAEAAVPADECNAYAEGYAAGYCAALGHDDWGSVTYRCDGGSATIINVTCQDYDHEVH
jgi:hypothetical protein